MRIALALAAAALLVTGCASRAPPPAEPSRSAPPRVVRPAEDAAPVSTPPAAPQSANLPGCANCPSPEPDLAPDASEVPPDIATIPDAVVVDEPKSRWGNPKTYEALGKKYTVMREAPPGFTERGRASWYGKKFHGRRTANGETYDMFRMTAAHKTLPLPSYVRVTHRGNGRSVVVRINDRGPFHPGRIIDLSYAAAARLDVLKHGSAEVEIEVISTKHGRQSTEPPETEGKPRYLEVGRFTDPVDAVALRERLAKLGYGETEFLQVPSPSGDGVENILRIGPFRIFSKLEEARVRLGRQDITAIPVAD